MTRIITDTAMLTRRALKESVRQPANDFGNALIPLFFFVVTADRVAVGLCVFGVVAVGFGRGVLGFGHGFLDDSLRL